MKRLTLLTILLVVVGLTAGALEVKPAFTLSGSATLTWGVDLETGLTGFSNSAAADLTVTLLAADGTDTHAGTGDWYGSITISNVELGFASDEALVAYITGGALGVSAKIVGMGGALAIGVYGAPTVGKDYVAGIEEGTYDDTVVDATETGDVGVFYAGMGTYVSYTINEMLMLGVDIVSDGDWTANTDNAYAAEFEAQVKAAGFTVNLGVNYGFGTTWGGNPVEFGVNVAGPVGPVALWAGFDAMYETAFAFDVGASATLTLANTDTVLLAVYYGDAFDGLDMRFVFTEPAAKGFVDNLDASLTAYVLDVGGTTGLEYEVIFAAGYLMGKLYPHFGLTYGDANDAAAFMTAYVHCDYTLFAAAKTVLFFEWRDIAIIPAFDAGVLAVGVTVTY
jgi:hypothetical protein